jgi:peptide/nickel transport system substrate-binding protein
MRTKRLMILADLAIFIAMLALVFVSVPQSASAQGPTPTPAAAAMTPAGKGALVDEVVFTEEPDSAKGVSINEAGDVNTYMQTLSDAKLFQTVKASKNLNYVTNYGGTRELTFNPYGPTFKDGRLNPFSVPAMREAMNWIIDRNYIAKEIYGGLAIPMTVAVNPIFPDYAVIADTAKGLEIKYSYDPKKAKSVFDAEMPKLGATLTSGKWTFQGKPVTIVMIIRSEDERKQYGDYVGKQLEDIGFTVDRQYKVAAEASPLWLSADPADGKSMIYTGGWVATAINRDWAINFDYYYNARGRSDALWQAYKPSKEFDDVSDQLAKGKFKDKTERASLMAKAATLSMQDSVRVWVVNTVTFTPMQKALTVPGDLAAGVLGSTLWPYTLKLGDKAGGTVKMAQSQLNVAPWNNINGTNWVFDSNIINATRDPAILYDPFTGLAMAQRVQKADVTVVTGAPVFKTLDWVTLNTADKIEVPKDAWSDWDAANQKFITAGERFTQTVTAKAKVVLTYDPNLFKTKWHDGSTFTIADSIMSFIIGFDQAKPESPYYDEAVVPAFKTFLSNFRGARIVTKDPLQVEIYTDAIVGIDAELIAANVATYFYPQYFRGVAPWHELGIQLQAEGAKELAMSSAKATKLKVEWTNLIAGPSLAILNKYATQDQTTPFVPYDKVLTPYLAADEAATRYKNIVAFYQKYNHYWIGNGPFFLYSVKPTEKVITIRKFADFSDPSDKWAKFAEPQLTTVAITGPSRVTVGQAAEFTINVTFKDKPYAAKDVDFVKFLVVDANSNVAFAAEAKNVKDGQWTATVTAEQSAKLAAGSNQLTAIVSSKVVAIPGSESFNFVTIK